MRVGIATDHPDYVVPLARAVAAGTTSVKMFLAAKFSMAERRLPS